MADYPIIADVSAHIVRTLRKKMCPEPIPSPNNIEISSPADQDVDYILGLYLYDIREESDAAALYSKGAGAASKAAQAIWPLLYGLYKRFLPDGVKGAGYTKNHRKSGADCQ